MPSQQTFGITIASQPAGTQLVSVGNLQLVGGFRVPPAEINGFNTRYISGAFDYNNGKWIANHGLSQYVVEYTEPGPMGSGTEYENWPLLNVGRWTQPFQTVENIGPDGVLWLDQDNLLCSGRKGYRSGFERNWMSQINIATGTETLIPLYDPALGSGEPQDTGNFHVMQAFGSGFCRIPSQYTSLSEGRTIGIGRGGYDVLGSPLGPALAAYGIGDTKVESVLIDNPLDTPARRDPNYNFPVIGPNSYPAQLGMWKDPDAGGGYWIAGDSSTPGFIDHPEFRGILFIARTVRGTIDYRAQGDTGSGGFFGVVDPVLFYSQNSSGNRGFHRDEPWNQTLPPARYVHVLYVYDPDDLTAEPVRFDFPLNEFNLAAEESYSPSFLNGITWDSERQILWACIINLWNNQRFPILTAYQLN